MGRNITFNLLTLLLIFFSCTRVDIPEGSRVKEAAVDRLAKSFNKRYGFYLCCTGGSSQIGKIKLIILGFEAFGAPLTLEEARREIIVINEETLNVLNEDKQLAPYLLEYPLTIDNLELHIYNSLPNRDMVLHPYIHSVSSSGNGILYSTYDANVKPVSDLKESYNEALKIVLEEKVEPGAHWQLSHELKEQIRQRLAAKNQVPAEKEIQE